MEPVPLVYRKQVYFDDVEVGDELPPVVKGPFSVERNVRFASVYGDFVAGHYDYKAARRYNHGNTPIGYGQQVVANLSQIVTDWIGRDGALKKYQCQVRANVFDGDIITMKGKVTRKYVENGERLVELQLWGEKVSPIMKDTQATAVTGAATVTLPAR